MARLVADNPGGDHHSRDRATNVPMRLEPTFVKRVRWIIFMGGIVPATGEDVSSVQLLMTVL
jgi:hypothetical protein